MNYKEIILTDKALLHEKIFDSLFDIVFIVDTDFKIISVSPSIRTLGYVPTDIELGSIYALANDNLSLGKVFENLSNGSKNIVEVPLVSKDKTVVLFEIFATKITINSEDLYIVVAADLTEKKTNEAQLKEQKESVELQLKQEREYRLQQDKFGLQKLITQWLIVLIGFMITVPYIVRMFVEVPSELTNSSFNVILMLVGSLAVAISSIFNTKVAENSNNNIEIKKQ